MNTSPMINHRRHRIRSASNWSSLLGVLQFIGIIPLIVFAINSYAYLWLLFIPGQILVGIWLLKLSAAFEALTPPAPKEESKEGEA